MTDLIVELLLVKTKCLGTGKKGSFDKVRKSFYYISFQYHQFWITVTCSSTLMDQCHCFFLFLIISDLPIKNEKRTTLLFCTSECPNLGGFRMLQFLKREELSQLVYTRTWTSSSNIFFQGKLELFSSYHGARWRVHWASHKFVIWLTQRRRQPFMQPNENSQLPKMLLFEL